MSDVFSEDRGADFSVLRSLGVVAMPALHRVAAAAVVPIDRATGQMVAVLLDRGIDIPGGHRQVADQSIEAVARRECHEEAQVELGSLHAIDVVESTYFGTEPEALTYMVIFAAEVTASSAFLASDEVRGREHIFPSAFLRRYDSGDRDMMSGWLRAAFAELAAPWR